MGKTLIIGAASNYDYDKLRYWVNSINESGFRGDVVLVSTNISAETIKELNGQGINVSLYGTQDDKGNFANNSKYAPHVERFFWLWNTIKNLPTEYEYVVVTDTRDVVFQSDPQVWLEEYCRVRPLLASSEGLLYKDEPWGLGNIRDTFGPFFAKDLEEKLIMNVGVIGGKKKYVEEMLLMIFQMSLGRPIPITDQAVFNFLLSIEPYSSVTFRTNHKDAWATQLGTTEEAVRSGAGDLGAAGNFDKYRKDYKDEQPIIRGHKVFNQDNREFCIVHQWDRIPYLKSAIEIVYGGN